MLQSTPTTKSKAPTNPIKNFRAELFDVCVMVFVAVSTMAYAFIQAVGVDVTSLPGTSKLAAQTVEDEIAGVTYQRLLAGLAIGLLGVLVYLAIAYFAKKYHLLHADHMVVVTNTSVWAAIAFLLYQERYHFLALSDFHSEAFFSINFWLTFIVLNILFFGLLFNAGFEHRVTHQIKKQLNLD